MSKIREVRISRRQAMRAAGTAGVLGLMPAAMRGKASNPLMGQSSARQSLPMPESTESNKFNVFSIKPKVVEPGGTVTEVTGDNFPVLKGNQAAVFYLVMKPGAVREPHWHPDAWELDVPISGTDASVSLILTTPGAPRRSSRAARSGSSRRVTPITSRTSGKKTYAG